MSGEATTTLVPQRAERARSFDVLASINLLRFDLQRFRSVQPETWQRVYDEELSFISEGIDRPLHTVFRLQEINGQLSIFHEGSWQPYKSLLLRGLETAEREAQEDPRKSFLAEWAARDLQVGLKFEALQPGERMYWDNPFPHEAHARHGDEFIGAQGLQVKRKMGFIYLAVKNPDGSLTLESHSVDGSEAEGFATARRLAEVDPTASTEDLIAAYDQAMSQKYGVDFYAGRPRFSGLSEENAWTVIQRHRNLIDHYFGKLYLLATQNLSGNELEIAKKRLTYGMWAALKLRLDQHAILSAGYVINYMDPRFIERELAIAYRWASAKGEILFGCGGSIAGESLLDQSADKVFDMIFGDNRSNKAASNEDKYGSLTFKCQKGHTNTRPLNRLINWCKTCGVSVKC